MRHVVWILAIVIASPFLAAAAEDSAQKNGSTPTTAAGEAGAQQGGTPESGPTQAVRPAGEDAPPAVAAAPPVYRLPKVGKPRGRIGGGRRGAIGEVARLHTLVPDHVGQTASAQPNLYWYLAAPPAAEVPFELTLIDADSIDPLVDVRLDRPTGAGLQRVSLAELGISLEPGQEYQWSIAAVPDPEDHSKDVVASGWIERVPAPEGIQARLDAAGADGAMSVYGASGLWYETLDAACERVRTDPGSEAYRRQLAALLEQVGLPADAAAGQPARR
jgi:hypothetical protein